MKRHTYSLNNTKFCIHLRRVHSGHHSDCGCPGLADTGTGFHGYKLISKMVVLGRAGNVYMFTFVNVNKRLNIYKFQPTVTCKRHHVQPRCSFFIVHQSFTKIIHHLRLQLKSKHGKRHL